MKRCPNCGRQFPDDANFCPADAGRLEPDAGDTTRGIPPVAGSAAGAAPAGEGPLGGRFETGAQVGGGLTGEVYQARDVQSGAPCAVKMVQAQVFPNQLMLQRAERELKQLERVQLAEVARIFGHGRKGDRLWIAMEWVDGAPLDRLVAQSGPMPPARAAALVRSVAQGLAEVAKQGVIHRDLAAKNILVGAGDQVKIINFSVALPSTDKVQGVPEFLSPEQIDGKPADQRSSIYSLGALLYFAVTGRPPFSGDPQTVHQGHQHGEVVRPSQVAGAPEAIDAIVLKAMEKHSARRFMTLHQLMSELDAFVANGAAASAQPAGKGMGPVPAGATLMGVSAFGPAPSPAHAGGQAGGPLFDAAPQPAAPHQAPTMMAGQAPQVPAMPAQPAPPMQPTVLEAQAPMAPQAPVVISKASLPPSAALPAAAVQGKAGKGKGKGGGGGAENKGKFRETMWFKKGELDEAAAAAAAAAKEGELALDKADALPIEDRYKDDGTLSRQDAERLSLRTGATQMMQAMRDPNAAALEGRRGKGLSEDDLVGEMKSGRGLLIVVVLLVLAAIGGLIYYFVS
jgi:hypothetical protein